MKNRLNVLIIEDSLPDAFLMGEYLESSNKVEYNTIHCEYLQQGLNKIETNSIDVVLIDLHLPDSNGPVGLEKIFEKYSNIPFIVLTGLSNKEVATSLLHKGAKDYLVKGEFDANLLERAILYTLERKRIEEHFVKKILAAQDTEKERIARDVHDSMGQNLTSAVLQLENIKSQIDPKNHEIADSVETALKCINDAILEVRGLSKSLMPQTVQRFGLSSGIESILITLGEKSSTHFNFISECEDLRFPENIELTFFRIAQESINNVLKYSKAEECNVTITYNNGRLILIIADNGIGFDQDDVKNQKGIGLNSIRTRAKSISGNLRIYSELKNGTNISISVNTTPLK